MTTFEGRTAATLTRTVASGTDGTWNGEGGDEAQADALPLVQVPPPLEPLGSGGMGSVDLVMDAPLRREVALKRMHPELAADHAARASFVREARTAGQLQHPNIVPIYGLYADASGTPCFSMQVVQGQTLSEWLQHQRKPANSLLGANEFTQRALEILIRVCDALSYAHSRGIVHRDVKPSNVMLGPHGRVYLLDWGIAEPLTPGKARPLGIAGTPRYMAPEQARGLPIDERADVFAVGAILYEIVAGHPPYGNDPNTSVLTVAQGLVVPISSVCKGRLVSPRLLSIIEQATAAEREARYGSIASLQQDLVALLRGGPDGAEMIAAPGQVIVAEGEPGDCAYLLISGSCRVVQGREPDVRLLRRLEAGDIFGELALVLEQPRSASVIAIEQTTLLRIDRSALEARGELDGWSGRLLKALAVRFLQLERQVRPV